MSIYVRADDGSRHLIAGAGLPGPPGKSAYQYAVEGGFPGTEDEFRAIVGVRSNDNLLDNWYFPDPINQRGQTEYTGAGYTIDRWIKWSEGSLEVVSGGIKLHANNSTVVFAQICGENTAELVGQTATLSILFEDVKGTFVIQVVDSFDLAVSSNGLHSVTGTLSLSTVNIPEIRIFSSNEGENSCIIKAVKLEQGPVQTLAHQDASSNWVLNDPTPNKALELAKCQRYQIVYSGCSLGMAHKFTDAVLCTVSLPQPMHTTPAILYQGNKTSTYRDSSKYNTISNIVLNIANTYTNSLLLSIMPNDSAFLSSVGDVGDVFISQDDMLIIDANL